MIKVLALYLAVLFYSQSSVLFRDDSGNVVVDPPIVLVPLAELLDNEVLQPLLDYVLRKVQTFQETVTADSLVQLLK